MTSGFNWVLYLEVADYLMAQPSEGFLRSATSRAYYGIFGSVKDTLVRSRGAPFPEGRNVHRQVINTLKDDQRPQVSQVGGNLDRLRRERNQADYEPSPSFDLERARQSLLWAREIEAQLNMLRSAFPSL